jgi:acylphosphatase
MLHVIISGDVQGVGYRQFVRYKANKLDIKGWVKNLSNGNVEAMLVGKEENLEKMIKICKRGPFLARVKEVKIEKTEDLIFDSFEIIKE